jgi:hypothetical protein
MLLRGVVVLFVMMDKALAIFCLNLCILLNIIIFIGYRGCVEFILFTKLCWLIIIFIWFYFWGVTSPLPKKIKITTIWYGRNIFCIYFFVTRTMYIKRVATREIRTLTLMINRHPSLLTSHFKKWVKLYQLSLFWGK